MDLLPSSLIDGAIYTFNTDSEYAISDHFDLMGYSTMNAIVNMGSSFIYIEGLCFLIILLATLKGASLVFKKVDIAYQRLKRRLLWGFIIRFTVQQYVAITLPSLINCFDVRIKA